MSGQRNETSLVMALRPDLVAMRYLPQDPYDWPLGIQGIDPRTDASPELGRRAIALQAERMGALLNQALSRLGGGTLAFRKVATHILENTSHLDDVFAGQTVALQRRATRVPDVPIPNRDGETWP